MVLDSPTQASRCPNFADLDDLESKLLAFIDEWNQDAHPFKWTKESFEKVLDKCNDEILAVA